ncbi:hypothetical protein ScPMuIL_007093 [Solemya velum]
MPDRGTWSRKVEFVLAAVGYSVGLGNVWRFPYLCFRSGGGAFLFPFFIMLFLCGVPLAYMEMATGQYTQQGPVGALAKMSPLFKGAGLATIVISFLFTTYYNVIITWSFYYLFSAFQAELPWSHCNHDWNSANCWDGSNRLQGNSSFNNGSVVSYGVENNITVVGRNRVSPTEDFFERRLLEKTSGIDDQGVLKWDLTLILLFCWIIVYFCIWKGPKSTGKVVYFTATFPYVMLLILLVRGLTLPGSMLGVWYFIKPRWELLLDAKVWVNAAAQNFNSLGIAFGGLITMSSYNKKSNIIWKDVLVICLVDAVTCLLAGFAIFSILGYLAHIQDMPVENVVNAGPGLVFIVYPGAFTTMPVPQLFAVLFFFMLICLGIDSQFASVEVVVTFIQDHFHTYVQKYVKRREVLVLIVCFLSFLCGLPNVTQGGIYFFQLIDYYAAALSLMILAFFEVMAITWIYGAVRLSRNVEEMNHSKPNVFFTVCWYISPLIIFGIWLSSLIQYQPFTVAGYVYPLWADVVGWSIAILSILCIPAGMVHAVYSAHGNTILQKFRNSFRPSIKETGIYDKHHRHHDMNPLSVLKRLLPKQSPSEQNGVTVWSDKENGNVITHTNI